MGFEIDGLRYFSVFGPNETHKGKFANNVSQFLWDMSRSISPIIYGDGTQTRDFTFVSDVVQANILAMKSEKDFAIYNVGTGIRTSFNDIIRLLNMTLGTDIHPTHINNPIKNYVQETLADISLAKSEIGYHPNHGLEDSIRSRRTTVRRRFEDRTSHSSWITKVIIAFLDGFGLEATSRVHRTVLDRIFPQVLSRQKVRRT